MRTNVIEQTANNTISNKKDVFVKIESVYQMKNVIYWVVPTVNRQGDKTTTCNSCLQYSFKNSVMVMDQTSLE